MASAKAARQARQVSLEPCRQSVRRSECLRVPGYPGTLGSDQLCLAATLERSIFLLDALRLAGLQPRFGAGGRRAKAWLAWVSNELAASDGVPRLVSGPSHRTLQPSGLPVPVGPRLHAVQHKHTTGRPGWHTAAP